MSIKVFVFLCESQIPSRDQWQASIERAGFNVRLDINVDLRTHSGYLPTKYNDIDSGFEFSIGLRDAIEPEDPDPDQEAIGDRDMVASFITHNSNLELITACAAAAALAQLTDGVLDLDSGEMISSSTAVASAQDLISSLAKDDRNRPDVDYSRLPPVEVATYVPGWIKCPQCGWRFSLRDKNQWNGQAHVRCARRIIPTGNLEPVPVPPTEAPSPKPKRWKLWK